MKKITLGSLMGLAIASVFSSCTMEKRVYSSGYHIEWNHNKNNTDGSKMSYSANETSAKKEADNVLKEQNQKLDEALSSVASAPVTDKKEDAALLASTENVVSASKFSKRNLNSLQKAQNRLSSSNNSINNIVIKDSKVIADKKENYKNKKESKAALGGGKSQLVALLLCFFLGFLGIHRFYLGYTGLGIMYLLFGLIGIPLSAILIGLPLVAALSILIIIDFIRIIIGALKPKGGSYSKTF